MSGGANGLFSPPHLFAFTNATPLSSLSAALLTVAAYLLTLAAVKEWVRRRGKPFDLKRVCAE